jgi:hypothetical protein
MSFVLKGSPRFGASCQLLLGASLRAGPASAGRPARRVLARADSLVWMFSLATMVSSALEAGSRVDNALSAVERARLAGLWARGAELGRDARR